MISSKNIIIILCLISIITGVVIYKFFSNLNNENDKTHDPKLLSKIRAIGLIVIGLVGLLTMIFKK
jgi:uncharacterized membrane protein YidH (DUF202 family)